MVRDQPQQVDLQRASKRDDGLNRQGAAARSALESTEVTRGEASRFFELGLADASKFAAQPHSSNDRAGQVVGADCFVAGSAAGFQIGAEALSDSVSGHVAIMRIASTCQELSG